MSKRMTADDFFTGLFAALAVRGSDFFSIRNERFDAALAETFANDLRPMADAEDIELDFRIRLHPIHGDSLTVRDGISNAAQRDLISLDNPEYQDIRLKLTPKDAEPILEQLPASRELFIRVADAFLLKYDLVGV